MLFLLCTLLALVHPVHETVGEIEWNVASKRMEVSLRLDVEDEQWIKKKMEAVEDGADEDVATWAIKYLHRRFRIADLPKNDGVDPTTYHWIGRDRDGAHVWWYFEIAPANGKRPDWIDHQVLIDREPDYMNRLLILDHTPPTAINVTSQQTKVKLDQSVQTSKTKSKTAPVTDTHHDDAPLPPTKL